MKFLYNFLFLTPNYYVVLPALIVLSLWVGSLEVASLQLLKDWIGCIGGCSEEILHSSSLSFLSKYILQNFTGSSILLIVFAFFIGKSLFSFILSSITIYFYVSIEKKLKLRLIKSAINIDVKNVDKSADRMVLNITQLSAAFGSGVVLNITRIMTDLIIVIFVLVAIFQEALEEYLIWILLSGLSIPILFYSLNSALIKLGKFYNQKLTEITNSSFILFSSRAEHIYQGSGRFLISMLSDLINRMLSAHIFKQILFLIPKYLIELLIIMSLLILLTTSDKFVAADLTIFAIAFLRLLPMLTSIMANLNALSSCVDTVERLSAALREVEVPDRSIFKDNMGLRDSYKGREFLTLKNFQLYRNNRRIFKNPLCHNFKENGLNIICGASGSGKTSLMEGLLGLGEKSTGGILLRSKEISSLFEVSDIVSYVPQHPCVLPTTIEDNVFMGDTVTNVKRAKLLNLFDQLKLTKLRDKDTRNLDLKIDKSDLSGGELHRLAIARALFSGKSILCLDEPTAALDSDTAQQLIDLLLTLQKKATLIVITHDQNLIRLGDTVLDLNNA